MSMLPPHLPSSRPAKVEIVKAGRVPSGKVEALGKKRARRGLCGELRILARDPAAVTFKSRKSGGC